MAIKLRRGFALALYASIRHLERSIDASLMDNWNSLQEYYEISGHLDAISATADRLSEIISNHSIKKPPAERRQPNLYFFASAIYSLLGVLANSFFITNREALSVNRMIVESISLLSSRKSPEATRRIEMRMKLSKLGMAIDRRFLLGRGLKDVAYVEHFNAAPHLECLPLRVFLRPADEGSPTSH